MAYVAAIAVPQAIMQGLAAIKEYALFKKRIWHIRVPREDYFEVEEMMIHGNVTTFLLTDIGILVRIEHPRIAKAMTALFDALWMTGIPRVFPE